MVPYLLTILLVYSYLFIGAAAQGNEAVGSTIGGIVFSVGGPVEGLTITLNEADGDGYIRLSNTTTGSDGGYVFGNLTRGGSFLLELRYGEVYHLKPVVTGNGSVEADFNLTGSAVISVVDEDGLGVPGLEMQLINRLGYQVARTTTGEDGVGGFGYLDVDEAYMVVFRHRGVPYSRVFRFRNGTAVSLVFKLLPTTTSDEEIEAYMHHVIVDVEGDNLKVWEAITYRNIGSAVFNNSWLRVWLPPDMEEFSSEIMDCCIQYAEEGIMFDPMEPIFPMQRYETSISYKIKITSSSRVLEKKLDYDTETIYVFIRKTSGIEADDPVGLIYEGERTLGGDEYLVLRGAGLKRGAVVSVRLRGPMSIIDLFVNNSLLLAAILLAAPAGFLLYYFKRQKASGVRREEETEVTDLRAEAEAAEGVLRRIKLDYEDGRLSDAAYKRLVSRYEARLELVRERIRRSGGAEGDEPEK